MKRCLTLFLTLMLLAFSGCGGSPEDVPPVTPAPEPTAAPTPEPTSAPEAPDSGQVLIHVAHVEGIAHPSVTITGREAATEAINKALGAMSHERYHIPRGDSALLSLVYGDTSPETAEALIWGGISFDTRTGVQLTLEDLAEDAAGLKSLCAEYLVQAGVTGDISAVTDDGHWYLSGDGLAFLPESGPTPQPVTVPYGALVGILKDPWIPPERLPVSGELRAAYTADETAQSAVLLDEVTVSGGMESVLLWAQGDIQDVRAVLVETPDGASFTETALLWYASALKDGEAVRLNVTVPEGIPTLKLCWQTDMGVYEALLSRNSQSGKLKLIPLVGELIDPDSPYAHITVQNLLGHWYNDKTGAQEQSLSLAGSSICYLWHKGLGYDGDGFLWELQRRDGEELCPQIVIHTQRGDLVYEVQALEDPVMTTDAGEFFRAEAVG